MAALPVAPQEQSSSGYSRTQGFGLYFHRIGPLGRFDLVVAMSVCQLLCQLVCPLPMRFFCVEELVWIVTRQRTGVERRPRVEP